MALGIGLEVQDWSVSDSKSSLENGDSGNSELKVGLLAEGKNLPKSNKIMVVAPLQVLLSLYEGHTENARLGDTFRLGLTCCA